MNQKATVIIIVIILLVGISGAVISTVSSISLNSEVPQASPSGFDDLLGDKGTGLNPAATQSALSVGQLANGQQAPAVPKHKQYNSFPGLIPVTQLENKKAVIETDKGIIEFQIDPSSPRAASNFVFLAQDGFYNGITFHRIEPGFVVQGGDPLGNGTGGPGYLFEDEPVTKPYLQGTVAMAKRAEPNTNGSQFFIILKDNPPIEPKYTIFGQVIKGMDVVAKLQVGDVMRRVSIAPSFLPKPTPTAIPTSSPTPTDSPSPSPTGGP